MFFFHRRILHTFRLKKPEEERIAALRAFLMASRQAGLGQRGEEGEDGCGGGRCHSLFSLLTATAPIEEAAADE